MVRPRISIIIPVLNEKERIDALISHIRGLDGGLRSEIIVADGSPTGDTLAAITCEDVTGIVSPPGRGAQMNAGAGRAAGDIVLFLHADTKLPADGLAKISLSMEGKEYSPAPSSLASTHRDCPSG